MKCLCSIVLKHFANCLKDCKQKTRACCTVITKQSFLKLTKVYWINNYSTFLKLFGFFEVIGLGISSKKRKIFAVTHHSIKFCRKSFLMIGIFCINIGVKFLEILPMIWKLNWTKQNGKCWIEIGKTYTIKFFIVWNANI